MKQLARSFLISAQPIDMEAYIPLLPQILFPAPPSSYTESWELLKWIPLRTDSSSIDTTKDIPVLFLEAERSDCEDYILYSHGNATDIGGTLTMLQVISRKLDANIIAYEYPSYGVRQNRNPREKCSSALMLSECEAVGRFVVDRMKVPLHRIVVMGRSIGTGPACHLARYLEERYVQRCRSLVLMSAYTSIRDVARGIAPFGLGWLCPQIFANKVNVSALRSPCLFIHGRLDAVIPAEHSTALYSACVVSEKKLHIIIDGDHNEFSLVGDLVWPIREFLAKTKNAIAAGLVTAPH